MKRLLALGATLLFYTSAAPALTIEPLPGSAPQSARSTTFFRNPVGVIVRDDNGSPMAGVRVFFSQIGSGSGAFISLPNFHFDSVTNARGVATSQAIASLNPGVVQITAEAGDALHVFAPLSIVSSGAETLKLVSGGGQAGRVGTALRPWTVRAFDAAGRAVPNAAVTFVGGLDEDNGESGLVTFNGKSVVTVMADASGIATSPTPVVKLVGWREGGLACIATNYQACTDIDFVATDWTVPKAAFVASAPLGVELGKPAPGPFAVKVIDNLGRPASGVPVRFNTPQPLDFPNAVENCGSFAGAYDVTVFTDGTGIAKSPLFTGTLPGMCIVGAWVGGLTKGIRSDVLVYAPETVTINAPLTVATVAGRPFRVRLAFTAGGEPIHGLPLQVEVVPNANGAGARLTRRPTAAIDSDEVNLELSGNAVAGMYHIAVTRGPVQRWIAVDQRAR